MNDADIVPGDGRMTPSTLVSVMRLGSSMTSGALSVTGVIEDHPLPTSGEVAIVALTIVMVSR